MIPSTCQFNTIEGFENLAPCQELSCHHHVGHDEPTMQQACYPLRFTETNATRKFWNCMRLVREDCAMTFTEISEAIGISKQAIQLTELRALGKLRQLAKQTSPWYAELHAQEGGEERQK